MLRAHPLLGLEGRPVIGHRGAAAYAPENTLVSFRRALEMGADALEFDVRLSADGEVVVMHDPTVDRTTDRTGPVGSQTAADLRKADAGFQFSMDGGLTYPFRNTGVRMPLLREVLETFPDTPLLIEIKEARVQEAVAAILKAQDATDRVVLAGMDHRALEVFREPPFLCGASRQDIARLFFRLGEPDPRCRAYAVPDHYYFLRVPSRRFVATAHRRGASVHVWTVDSPELAGQLWDNGVNGIVTNRPDAILQARQRRK